MMAKTEPWLNRIIGEGEEAPDQLLANPSNWRIHPKAQQEALSGILSEVGWVQRVLVNQRTGHMIDGHARVELAISRGEKTVPVVYVDLSEEEEKAVLATFDPLSAMAVADQEVLDSLLAEVNVNDEALRAMLKNMESRIPNGGGPAGDLRSVIAYEIVFEDDEQQQAWFEFLRHLKGKWPEEETIAGRITRYLRSVEW